MSRFLEFWAGPRTTPLVLPDDIWALRKDGATIPVEASVTYVPTADGGRLFAFVTEVSERRRTERTLATYTRELEYRAHQLRRLASALTLAEQRASERLALRLHGNLQQLLASGQSTLDLLVRRVAHRAESETPLFDLLKRSLDEAVAETRALAREVFPQRLHNDGLAEGLRWQAGWFREKLGLNVDLTWDPAADPDRRDVRALLFESVRELLFNAAKHGHVQRVNVRLGLAEDDQIQIVVADEGVGFDPTLAFGPRDEQKTGLGLFSISERIALIGGRLDVQSAPGAGARFTIQVPRSSEHPDLEEGATVRKARTREPAPPPEVLPLSVLIVDDHALVRQGLRLLFESHPELRIVGEACSGAEAVAQARALRPDAIVMDVSMPEMDGVEATRQIVGELPGITILGLSAQERTREVHAIEQAGAAGFFTKGQDGDLLIAHLLALHERSAAAAQRTS
jgi:signal transduction histidine kinase